MSNARTAGIHGLSSSRALRGFFPALALLWFANIGMRTLVDPDEGRYAEVPREMLATGDWIVPHLNGIQYLDKPPLQYWATAALYSLLGTHAWVARLWPSALGFASLLLVHALGRRLYGGEAARAGVLLLAGAPLFFVLGHLNTLDMALCFFLTAGLTGFVLGLLSQPGSAQERRWMRLGFLALGLAVLQKGLVALALPAVAFGLHVLFERDLRILRRLHLASGLAIVLVLNAPWWALVQQRNPEFLHFFFVREHLLRFLTDAHAREQPWWFLSAILVGGTLPWTAPIVRGSARSWRGERALAGRGSDAGPVACDALLLAWAAAVFLFYSPSGSKLAPYLLPMLPPLALLGGREIARGRGLRASLVLGTALSLAMLAMLPLVHSLVPPGARHLMLSQIAHWALPAGISLAGSTAAAVFLMRRAHRDRAISMLGFGLVAALAILTCGTNALERERGGPAIAPAIAAALASDAPLYCVGMYPNSVAFTLGRTCTLVDFKGEMQIRFDDGEPNFILTLDRFLETWKRSPAGVAIVHPESWERLRAMGIPATILSEQPYAIAIGHP